LNLFGKIYWAPAQFLLQRQRHAAWGQLAQAQRELDALPSSSLNFNLLCLTKESLSERPHIISSGGNLKLEFAAFIRFGNTFESVWSGQDQDAGILDNSTGLIEHLYSDMTVWV
jgi:hypothetical protein